MLIALQRTDMKPHEYSSRIRDSQTRSMYYSADRIVRMDWLRC